MALLQAEADDEDADVVYLPAPVDAVVDGSPIRQTFVFALRVSTTTNYYLYKMADKTGYVAVYKGTTAALSVAVNPNLATQDMVVKRSNTGSTPENAPALIFDVELSANTDYFVVSHLDRTQTPTHHGIELRNEDNVYVSLLC